MNVDALQLWLDKAAEATGAAQLELRRSRSKDAQSTWPIAEAAVDAIASAAVADLQTRRMRAGRFSVVLVNDKGSTLRQRVESFDVDDVDDDGEGPSLADDANPYKAICVSQAKMIEALSKALIDACKGPSTELRLALGEVVQRYAEAEAKHAEMLATVHDLATLRQEREAEDRKSADRLEMGKTALSELGPIVGAAFTMWRGSSHPAVRALLETLTAEQQATLMNVLTPSQRLSLQAALDALTKKTADVVNGAAEPAKGN